MFDLASAALREANRGLPRVSRLIGTDVAALLVCLAAGGYKFVAASSPPSQCGCGTLYSKFGDDRCLHISFSGEVSAHQSFERKFGKDLAFRLDDKSAAGGWTVEILPEVQPDSGRAEYVWVVNPPYHFSNVRYLDTSYGTTAKQAVSYPPREFNFVVNDQQYRRAADLVEHAAMSHSESEHKTQDEFDKESQEATQTLLLLPVSKGRLTILQSRIVEDESNDGLGSIEWISFKMELHVPCDFVTPDGSPDLQIDKSKCSGELKAKQN
jgi:hypothetical protein